MPNPSLTFSYQMMQVAINFFAFFGYTLLPILDMFNQEFYFIIYHQKVIYSPLSASPLIWFSSFGFVQPGF